MLVRVVFEMASPVILTDPLHLDAIITAVHPDAVDTTLVRTMDAKGSIKGLSLPLERAGLPASWVWCASAAYFPDTAKPFSGKYCRRKDEYDADWIGKNVLTIGGIYKNRVAAASGVATPEVCFLAVPTDTDELLALCRKVQGLGRLRASGYGMIRGVRLERVTRDWRDALVYAGKAMRTLPAEMLTSPAGKSVRIRPPYWARTDRVEGAEPGDEAVLSPEVGLC